MTFDETGVSMTREEHKRIKKFDRQQMSDFLEGIFTLGMEEQEEDIFMQALTNTLNDFKGIGENRKQLFLDMFQTRKERLLKRQED